MRSYFELSNLNFKLSSGAQKSSLQLFLISVSLLLSAGTSGAFREGPCEAELYSLFLPKEVAYISGL